MEESRRNDTLPIILCCSVLKRFSETLHQLDSVKCDKHFQLLSCQIPFIYKCIPVPGLSVIHIEKSLVYVLHRPRLNPSLNVFVHSQLQHLLYLGRGPYHRSSKF